MSNNEFIESIAGYVKKYAYLYGITVHSPIIAQAILESASGISELAVNAHNYFGLKYREGRCKTATGIYVKTGSEQNADGSYVSSVMQWCKFPDMENGVIGYFDFTNNSNYANLKGVEDPKTYLANIKADGYATSLDYVKNLMSVIEKYNLRQYDKKEVTDMSNSSLVKYTNISPNRTSPRTQGVDRITPHCVVGQLSAESICGCFTSPSIQASCNYGIGTDGRISLCVEEKDRSWCSSSGANDHRAITIECASDRAEPYSMNSNVYESLVNLCVEICKRHGKSKLIWFGDKDRTLNYAPKSDEMILTVHRWFANKSCPGDWLYARLGDLAARVTSKLGGESSTEHLYRVRKSWSDEKSQTGAYAVLENAKNACGNGYTVYDWNGKPVYTNSGTPSSGNSESDFVSKVGKLATADMAESGILASVTTAQAILESGYGTTDLAVNANNIFGMKCSLSGNTWGGSTWDGTSKYTKDTKEQHEDGSEYTVTADFRKYGNIEASMNDHSAYLNGAKNGSSLRYAGLKGCTDYRKAIQIIKDGGYATDVTYVQKICNIIERWNLTQYDVNSGQIEPETKESWYRVRSSWADAKSQKGAFHDLTNAKNCADSNPGYSVYDESGNVLYANMKFSPYTVRVSITDLNIREGAGTDFDKSTEGVDPNTRCIPVGTYTIVEESTGQGSTKGWGKLKSGAGWISLDYTKRV